MGRLIQERPGRSRGTDGFSIIELLVSCAFVMILTAIAIPSLTRSYQIYQLNSSATQLSGMLKLTRFEAIRKNTQVGCQFTQNGANWIVSINSPTTATNPAQMVMSGTSLVAGGGPNSTNIATAMGATALTTLSGANNAVTFDQRGAVVPAGGAPPYVFYIQNVADPTLGYRAVVVMASGIVHVWNSTGTSWVQVS